MPMGAIFYSSVEIGLKSAKNMVFFIFCMPMGGGLLPIRAPLLATLLQWSGKRAASQLLNFDTTVDM